MKYLVSVLLLFGATQIAAGQDSSHRKLIEFEKQAFHSGQTRPSATYTDNYDVNYHRCEWTVDPAVYFISGEVTSYFTTTVPAFSQIEFDCSTALHVDSVLYHGTSLSYSQITGNLLRIALGVTLAQNTLDSISVYYHGAPSSSGFGSFIQDVHAGTPVLWTLSQPDGARDWWPCKQKLNDKIDSLDIYVTTPLGNRVASNGLLMGIDTLTSEARFHWLTRYPVAAYLVAIATTNYADYSDWMTLGNGDSLQILNYVYPEDLSTAQSQTPEIISAIGLYDSLTIDYPFKREKYGHCEFSWGGGMEHQTMSFVVGFDPWLINHECAHQWFGDYITCGSWEDIWLNEGFATYMEALTEEFLFPWQWNDWKLNTIGYVASVPDGSVLCPDTTDVNRIFDGRLSYDKGSLLLHMLRWELGDSAFFQGLRNYLQDPSLAFGYAKTPDFKAHMEAVSGLNLTTFFDQWYYKEGYPSYFIEWYQIGTSVNITVNQAQSNSSVSFFEMPIPVEFIGQGHDTILVFNNTFSGQQFNFQLPFTVSQVNFDPELWILSANNNVVLSTNEQVNKENGFRVYPNPAQQEISIELPVQIKPVSFVVFDTKGAVVLRHEIAANEKTSTLDIGKLSAGSYKLLFTGVDQAPALRFVKE